MVFCGIQWYSVVFSCILWYSVVFCGIQLYIVVFSGILWYSAVFSGSDQCSIVGGPEETGEV